MATPLQIAQAEIGGTNAEKYWSVIWPDRPSSAVNWCGCFVSYCFVTAGEPLPKIESAPTSGFVYVPDEEAWGTQHSDWFHSGAQPGDVVLYDWNGDDIADHTGIVESANADGSIVAIEGNTGSPPGVHRMQRPVSDILGFVRPGGVMANKGVDSAYAPSLSDVRTAVGEGISWWLFYLAGGGALNNWTNAQIDVLRQGGLSKGMPCFVPALTSQGRIQPSANPEADAQRFVGAIKAAGVSGAAMLDTEASMRGDPWTTTYEARFGDELQTLGFAALTYAGGFTFSAPPKHKPMWIVASENPPSGTAYQYNSGKVGGTSVDFDAAAADFPLAQLVGAPPPFNPYVTSSSNPTIAGGPMPSETFTLPTDGQGRGWVLLDGSDARVNHLQIPWSGFVSVVAQGGFPPVDGYGPDHVNARPQNRNGYVCVEVTGAAPNFQANVILVHSGPTPAAYLSRGDAESLHGEDMIVTDDNWQSFEVPAFGGGAHDPANQQPSPE